MRYRMAPVLLVCWAAVSCGGNGPGTVPDAPEPVTIPVKDGWTFTTTLHGGTGGEASFDVVFPSAGAGLPLTFGIPLGQVGSADAITLYGEDGSPMPASFAPLGNWATQPARWTLVSTTLSAPAANTRRTFTIRWGRKVRPSAAPELSYSLDGNVATVTDGGMKVVLSPSGIESVTSGGATLDLGYCRPRLDVSGVGSLVPDEGSLEVVSDTPAHVCLRYVTELADSLDLHREYDFHAGSRFIRCRTRFINRSLHDVPLDGLVPLELNAPGLTSATIGWSGGEKGRGRDVSFIQRAFDAGAAIDGKAVEAPEDGSYHLWLGVSGDDAPSMVFVLPYFRGFAGGEDDLESVASARDGAVTFTHYRHSSAGADVRLRETMARTFTHWLVIDPPECAAKAADAVLGMPYVVHDRDHLTGMGVFQESVASRLFDAETSRGALYFETARVGRPEYLRCGRGTEPEYDGEGAFEVDLHAGGMVFGEVFQYFTPEPNEALIRHYHGTLGIPMKNILTGGKFAYRNGDIPLCLFQQYLRTGKRELHDLARIHALLFADYALSHAPLPSQGIGHYYCNWYGNPYVYQRFEGLLLGYLVTGDRWLFESARAMADVTVRNWVDGNPVDASMQGGPGGVQSRSPYVAKMNVMMYDLTGEKQYLDNAVRLAEWAMSTQEPEGWYVMNPTDRGTSRAYRCTPIFIGYSFQGLWPLYWRTRHEGFLATLMRGADWYVSMQEDVNGNNPGTFPNSYWYGEYGSEHDIPPIRGNYATTSHAANILLQSYLASDDQTYFYSANAAWVGVLNHQTEQGGVPLENDITNSVWSHVMVESLPQFGAVAEARGLPVVLSARTVEPGTSFMGKGATWDGTEFRFGIKYRNPSPVRLRLYFPAGRPSAVLVNGSAAEWTGWNGDDPTMVVNLPPSDVFRACDVVVRR